MAALSAALLLGGAGAARAAISEGFESIFGTSYGAYTSKGWYISKGLRGTTQRSGSYAARFTSVANAYMEYQSTDAAGKDGGVGAVTFWYREWATTDASTFSVQYNVNGAGWTTLDTITPTTTTYTLYSNSVNNANDNIIVRIYKTGTGRVLIDDFYIYDYASASAPTVTTLGESSVAATSAVLGGNVTAAGGAPVTNRGVCYKTSASVTISDNKTQIGSDTGAFSNTVSSLSVNTRYYYVAYAQNSAGTSLGSESNFWTLANVPSAPTVAAVSSSSVSVDVNVNGNPSTTTFAIYETTQSKYVQSDGTLGASAYWATDATWGTKSVTGLGVNQQYTFKVKARNGAGTPVETDFSGTASKYTLAAVPSAPTVNGATSSSLDVAVNENGNPSGTTFAIQRTSDSYYLKADGTWQAAEVWQTKAAWGTTTAKDLAASTVYFFKVKAKNGDGTETAFSSTASGTTSASGCPSYWTSLYNRGAPVYTYYLGDRLANQFEFGINTDTTGWSVEYGVGRSTDGSSWTWRTADWSRMDDDDNRVWISKTNEHQFTATGNWYYAGRFTTGSCTYYADGDWEETTGGGLAAVNYFTVNALTAPSSCTAVKDTSGNTATRVDLGWAQGGGKNVLITRAPATPTGGPTQGTGYSANDTFGNQTVIAGSQAGTSLEVTGLTPGATYYFTFYSENNSYYSTAVTASAVTLNMPQARNTSGSASPGAPAGTIYLGDTGKVFTFESWGTVETAWGQGRLWLRQGNADLSGGMAGAWGGMTDQNGKSVTSGVFNATGTWYWGIQMDYGATYGTNFWYKASSASWVNLAANGTGAGLTVTVSAIGDPGSQTATVASTTQINLSWAKNAVGHNVMVVRSTDSSFTAPTQGTAYTAGSSTIGGDLVIYNGNGTSYNDTGRTQGTIYYYKFYSVNNDYYSAGVTANATTWTLPTVSTTSATPGTPADPTQANATGNVTAEGGQSVTERGIVWNTTGAPTTANTKVAHASGGTGSFTVTLTSLTPGQKIYYRAYAINSVGTAYGSTLDFTADCFTNGPGILAASAVGLTNFTANWSAVGGASGYQLDVSTNAVFGGGVGAALTNDCADVGGGTTSSYLTRIWTNNTDVVWTAYKARTDQKVNDNPSVCLRDEAGSYIECTTIPNGISTLKFDVQQSFTGTGGQLTVYVNGTSKGTFDYDTTVQTAEFNTINVANVTSLVISNNTAARPAINNLVWTDYGSPSFVPGFSNLTVAATSQVVTGLTSDVKYFYRVRAVNDYCTSTNSATTNVTTVAATANVVLGDNGTQVVAARVPGGTTKLILHQFKLAVTVAKATLAGVDFTTAGTYATADIGKFQVWYSDDDSLATTGDNVQLGSDITTGLGAGSHGVSSLSQAILAASTGYVFITADIAANPGCEKTISVAAITTGDLTYAAAATETGSTTAGGVQTLVAAEPTLHASALLFPSVGSDQLGVSWTSGNGDKRIVVVTEYDAAGLWLFDEGSGTTAKDATVNANDGTLYNTPTWTTRTGGGGALNFLRASSEYVEVLNNAALQTTNSQTISFWLRPTDFPGRQNPWNKAYGGEGTITLEPARHLNYYFGAYGGDGGSYDYVPSVSLLTAGQWKHLVVVRDMAADKMRWYFDGVLVNEATIVNNTSFAKASTANLRFGSGYAGYLNGDMAEPMLLDRALTATEVANLYAMGSMATGWVPTDGTVPSGVNSDFSAADDQAYHSKIVYDGTGTNVTVTGLKPDTAYRVRVYEYNGAGACVNYLTDGTPASAVQPTACPAAPTGLFANPTNTYDFTANWSASTGARGYIIDVSTNATFSGSGGTLLSEAFATLTATVPPTGWTSSLNSDLTYVSSPYFGEASPSYKFHTTGQTLTSPTFVTGATNLQFWAYGNGNSGSTLAVSGLVNSVWTLVDTVSIAQNGATYNVALNSQTTQIKFRFTKVVNVALDDVIVQAATGSYVPGFEHLPVSGTSVSVTGLEDSVTYYWRVAATGARCTGDYSSVASVTTIAGPPPVPTGVNATDGTILNHVQVTWTDLNDKEQHFLVWRNTSSDSNTAAVLATLAANTVSYNDTTAGVGTQYWYWVMSSNAVGASALSVSDSGFRKLPTVQNVQATDCTSVDYSTITWTDSNAGETGYGIWYSTTANSGSATWLANTAADTTTYNHAGTPGTLYYYWVRATNSTCETLSDFQAAGAGGVRQLATVTVDASDGTDTSRVVVQWTDITGETGYSVWRSETDSFSTAEWLATVAADGNVLSEDFEDSWAEAPSGWSRELVHGTTNWLRASGGHNGKPAAAHGGTYNALLYSSTKGYTNRLITPSMDLSGFSSAYVDFWHAQAVWSTDQDILRVLYRTSSVASWVQLDEYTGSITSWTERNLSLPNLSGDYYVAFEGVANYGYGVVLDDVAVTGTVSSVTNYYDEEASAGVQYYYWVVGTNAASGCQSEFGAGDGGWRRLVENPSAATFTRDGREMVRAAITANAAANDILVLHSTAAEVSGTPALNSSYAVGDTLGNAKVVYNGAAADFREHVVAANSTNHYRVFSVLSNAYYSSGVIPTGSPIETKPYQPNVGVETFSYTNVTLSADSFTNKAGGANWATGSNWVLEASGTSWQVFTNDAYDGRPMFFTAASNMATLSGNRAFADLNGDSRWVNATRQIPTTNSGVMFVSALMAYRYEGSSEGTDRWITMALMNGDTEELEFGKVWGANRTFTIRRSGANGGSSYGLNPYGDSTNNWYWVVLKYDFDNDIAKAAAFYRGENIPSSEPSTWDVEWSSMSIAQVTALRLKAGSGTDWLGGALFDEVRVSSVWPALLGEPDLVITPESEDFGNVEVGRPDLQTFWVQNIGGDKVPMTVSSLTLGGANPTNFLLSTNTLGTIEYGQSNSFTVTFLPNVENQAYSAMLYVTNSSGVSPVLVSLAGYGIPSQLTNAPAIDAYEVGETNQVTDAMVTSGVFSVVLDVYHPAGLATATYDLLNGDSTVILADQTFESWVSANGEDYVLSNATHTGYWPGTPADDYLVRAVLISSNGYGITNTAYASLGTSVEADDLFISEYIEGSSNNKAVEIYNGTGASVDLSDYTLRLYFNGGTSPSSISLSGTLAAGGVYVVAHSSANATILAAADLATGSLTFNGNDVVALAKSGSNIDVIGTIGSSADFAKDVTKVRKSSVTDGTTTYATGEWDNYAADTTSYLGSHTMEGGDSGTPMQFRVIDDDEDVPVITNPLVNGATTPAGSASGPTIAIGDVPAGGFGLAWDIQDTGSGVFAASNHYTLARSNAVISSGAVPTGSDGDGQGSALAVGTTIAKSSLIWGDYVLSLAGADYDPEWDGDISSVSNVYYFVIAAPSIGLLPSSLDYGSVERDVTSNLTVAVTNSGNADLVVSGIGFSGTGSGYFSVASPAVPLTVTAGTASNVVVSFTPTAGGTFSVTMTLTNNTPNAAEATVSIAGECYDPETAPPSIYDYGVVDAEGMAREVTDHALAHGEVTLDFTLWHYMGVDPATASYDLLDPSGALVWTNGTFDTVTETTLNSKTCQVFTAAVPDILPAVTGVYTARVTATSSNAYSVTDQATYDPPAAGSAVAWPLDRFSRPDAVNDIGAGWVPTSTGETNHNIQLRDHALQFYGEGGTAGNGRLSVVRDVSSRYDTVLTNNAGTLTWAFNFYSGQANMTGLGSGKYAGLYVLGSTSANFVDGYGNGYAVRICSNQVALVRFTGGLNADSDATTIGTPASLTATTPMGIRVDLDPATGAWTLYTTNWGGAGPEAFGDPLVAAELATSTVDATYLGTTSLPYVGCYWNHGAATPSSTYGAVFDEVYAPYVMPTAPLMNFSVVDEDWTGPVHSDFNTGQYTVSYIDPGGLTVTGLVADANGVYAGTSNVWTLFSNSTQVASGFMTMTPDTDGAGTTASPAALSTTIPFSALNTTNGTFIFQLVSTDYDVDRPGDSMSTTSSFTIVIVDTEAPTPTSVTAVGDGMEMAVLTWNLNGAQGAVVLRSADPDAIAGATILTMGEDYNQGDAGPNGTTVAYHGTNQAGAEIVLPMGSLNYFRLFGANGTVYSAGHVDPTNSVQLLEYEDGEIVDQFAYTNNYIWTHDGGGTNWVYLNDQAATGQGWDGGWTGDSNKVLTIENINLLSGSTHYPDPYANKLQWVANSQVATNVEVVRKLATKRSGRTFIAFMMNYKVGTNSCSLTNKYLGLSLMSGTDADKEEIFFGKVHGYDKDGGIDVPGVGKSVPASPDNYAFNAKHGDDYMIVGEWDPAIKTARMWAFYQGDTTPIPQEYTNATPFAVYSNAALNVADITGIRLAAGMSEADTNSLDHVYFDEVRVGDTWDEVLLFNYPEAWNFRVGEQRGTGTNAVYVVTDGELAETGKAYPISYLLNHRTGVTNAQFNISTNTSYLTGLYSQNIDLLLNPANATDRSRWFTNWVTTRLDTNDVTLGVYTTRVWMTAVSGKATNTIFMEGRAGATDLFFGEFGEGNVYDKYVEIYNGTGGTIDLSQYQIAHQNYGPGITPDYTKPWTNFCRLAATETLLPHGTTMLILNGSPNGKIDPAMTNALTKTIPPRPFLITTNKVLEVSGNDPMGLFKVGETNEWIDMCGIGPSAARYIMRRVTDAEVPRSYPLVVATNQWDYRDWESDLATGYTNFLATAGLYDRDVGLGGYITFTVEDDDALPPAMGTNNVLMIGTEAPYTALTASNGSVEVVLTAWNFNGDTPAESATTWSGSLIPNGTITCHPDYTPGPVDDTDSGTSENDMFGVYDQPNDGVAELASIGTYFTQADTAWIQYEIELTSADDMVLSWAEAGGSYGFDTAQLSWSSDGVSFSTNAAWPSWDPTDGSTYVTRYAEFDGVVTPGLSKVYIRINLGPGYGGVSGYYRMDNVQLTGYPQEFQVTDGQIAASGNKFQFRANVYDTNSGLNKAQATMKLQDTTGTRVPGKDIGDGSTTNSTLWWELNVTRDDITDYVNESLSGKGLTINVKVPDADADRPNDATWLDGRIGQVRVIDDDTDRPKLTLTSMKPLSSILAQWTQMTEKISLMPTKSDAGVEAEPLKTKSGTDDPKNPNFSIVTTNGYYIIEAFAWQGQNKCWLIEVTPEADMSLTNLTFTSYMHRTNGVSNYRIDHYVDGAPKATILPATYWVNPPAFLDPNAWYTRSHGWTPGTVVLEAGKVNQIRIYGLGSSNIGARWRISDLTLWQAATDTDGVTEVTDAEFTSGSFKLTGHAWDTGSGIASTTHATESKRPMFSLNAPDGKILVTNQLFAFTGEVVDGGATTKEDGAFECLLPTPVYTNVMLGGYTGEAHVWDYDSDRTSDDLQLRGDLAMYVVDNDVGVPTAVGTVRVNGMPAGPVTRETAPWTNNPEFIITLDSAAEDQDPGISYSTKQRELTGIGEYRVTTNDVTGGTASNRAAYGTPYAVATTNGALANYGFEMLNVSWTLDGDCSYHRYNLLGDLVRPWEGTNCLKQTGSGTAYQWIEFLNTNAVTPSVGVGGRYRIASGATPILRIEAFTSNNLVTPVATRDVTPGTSTSWASFGAPTNPIGDVTVAALKISLIGNGGTATYWDDLRLSVDIGNNRPSMRFLATVANQGIGTTNYLFAVDADNNRAGDRLAGEAKPFFIAYDITRPTPVATIGYATGASTELVDDPTTQFDVQWQTANVGPDNPADVNYPAWGMNNRDLLSPWGSYKVYYGVYNPMDVPPGDVPSSTDTGFIYTNFIATGDYLAWSNVTATSTISDPSASGTNYLAMTNLTQSKIRLYDLDFDQDYVVVIVGVDRAGNEGPAGIASWATNNTIKFALTRGWTMAKSDAQGAFPGAPSLSRTNVDAAAGLAWLAAGQTNAQGGGFSVTNAYISVSKDYDLIYMDGSAFRENTNNTWQLVGSVRSNWFVDDGAIARPRGSMRFYRASYKDRWKTVRLDGSNTVPQRPLASEEVYAMHNVILSGGQNFVALHGVPYTNTLQGVFGGLETFPGGGSTLPAAGSTVVEFFSPGTNAPSVDQYFLNSEGKWIQVGGSDVTQLPMPSNFFSRGFSINLPQPLPESYATTTALDYNQADLSGNALSVPAMVWAPVAQVPTNNLGFSQVITTGSRTGRVQTAIYNLVALRLPVAAHPSQMRLLESGFVGGAKDLSDHIYTVNTRTKSPLSGSSIYYDSTGITNQWELWQGWKFVASGATVPWGYFKPNDVIVIVSRNWVGNGSWTWNYHPTHFYTLPTRWMGWTDVPAPPPLASEPTTQAANFSTTNVSAGQMTISWSSGNGERRIVVVRQGTSTTWTPTDGIAPSGVNNNYAGAGDKGDGNRICYDGTGSSFTLVGLTAQTGYAIKIFEYNGTGTAVNYFTAGAPLAGYQATTN